MANEFKSIGSAFKGVGNAIKTGQKRALNRAASSTRTFISRDVRSQVGLKSKDINKRVRLNRTDSGFNKKFSFRSSVGIATKTGHPLRLFSPKAKKVRLKKGTAFGNTRIGVTAKIRKSREFIPTAFLMNVRGNQIVAARKGKQRKPTVELRTKAFIEAVMNGVKKYRTFMTNEYRRIVGREVTFAVSKRLGSNSED